MTLMFIDVYLTRMQLEILRSLAYSFHKQFRITPKRTKEARKKKRLEVNMSGLDYSKTFMSPKATQRTLLMLSFSTMAISMLEAVTL